MNRSGQSHIPYTQLRSRRQIIFTDLTVPLLQVRSARFCWRTIPAPEALKELASKISETDYLHRTNPPPPGPGFHTN
jgi:hypothetical protein